MKGQGAMEYMMEYGWVLLVVIIVFAALVALGVFDPIIYKEKQPTWHEEWECVEWDEETIEEIEQKLPALKKFMLANGIGYNFKENNILEICVYWEHKNSSCIEYNCTKQIKVRIKEDL